MNHFQGKLSDLQIWNKTFNDAYLQQTNLSSVDLTENGLVGYYQLNNQSTETKHRSCKIAKSEFEGHDGIIFHGNLNMQKENKMDLKNDEDCGFGENKKQIHLVFHERF